jgi:hypothetical protein
MKHIEVSYVDLANIAGLILKEGTAVEDKEKYIIGFAKDIDLPVILELDDTTPSCILISVDFDVLNEKIIDFYMKGGIYANIIHNVPTIFSSRNGARIILFGIGK